VDFEREIKLRTKNPSLAREGLETIEKRAYTIP